MRTSNPVLSRQFANPYAGQHTGPRHPGARYTDPRHTGPRPGSPYAPEPTGSQRPMTFDDVIVKAIIAIALVVASAAVTWTLLPPTSAYFLVAWGVSMVMTLVLSIMAAVRHTVPAPLVMLFALSQGVFVGGFSQVFELRYPGVVIQAVMATFVAALVTLFAYKFFNIRVTPKFQKIVLLATVSFGVLMLVNFVLSFFNGGGLGLRSGGLLSIGVAAVGVLLGVLNLVLDFDHIERGVRAGVPADQAWRAAFGLTLTLIWLYLELLRLISYLRR